ncbi:MAG: PKD domain-containing protein, partial [Saprospiraceae bacterium]|nr:PKD domain-containing protein [Saprospiraceae bacterium]
MIRLLSILMALTIFSCSKIEIEPDSTSDPVFQLSGEVDGNAFELIAGNDGYFQSTSFEVNDLQQYELKGKLELSGCNSNCPPSLEMIFKSPIQSGTYNVQDALETGSVRFFQQWEQPEEVMLVRLFSKPSGVAPYQYEWDLGDGRFIDRANPQVTFFQPGTQNITLTVTDASGCSSSQTRSVAMDDGTSECSIILTPPVPCEPDSASGLPRYCVKAIATGGQPPYTFHYDNQTFTGSFLEIQLDYFPAEDLCVSVEDAVGNSSTNCANYLLNTSSPSGTQSCNTQFTYQSEISQLPYDSLQAGSVEVIWTDASGKSYSSAMVDQGNIGSFNLISVEPYDN